MAWPMVLMIVSAVLSKAMEAYESYNRVQAAKGGQQLQGWNDISSRAGIVQARIDAQNKELGVFEAFPSSILSSTMDMYDQFKSANGGQDFPDWDEISNEGAISQSRLNMQEKRQQPLDDIYSPFGRY